MLDEGKIMIGYSSTKGSIYFWRIVFSNPFLTKEVMEINMRFTQEDWQRTEKNWNAWWAGGVHCRGGTRNAGWAEQHCH